MRIKGGKIFNYIRPIWSPESFSIDDLFNHPVYGKSFNGNTSKGVITMANYNGTFRSSYFQVENEEAYESLKHHLVATDGVEFWDQEKDGEIYHGFGGYGCIVGYAEDAKAYEDGESNKKPDYDKFMNELSKIIKKGDVCIIMKVCHWKLGYVGGVVHVITKNHVEFNSLVKCAEEILKDNGVDPSSVSMYLLR